MPSLLSWRPPGPVAKLPISGSQEMLPWPLCKEQRMTQSYIEPNAAEQCVEKSNCYFWNSKRSWLRNLELNSLSLGLWLLFGIAEDHNKKEIGISREKGRQFKNSFDSDAQPEKHHMERLESNLCFTLESGDPNGDQHHKFRRFSAIKKCLKM